MTDPALVDRLVLRIDYDDGFVAYLNNTEVARANLLGIPGLAPRYDSLTSANREAGLPDEFDLTARKGILRAGENLLCIQVHNADFDSSDLTCHPELLDRTLLGPDVNVIRGITELQQLLHVRGIYARRQLQTVLAEFWENHFTTDATKVAVYLDALQNANAQDAMPASRAAFEAAEIEAREYQFFYDHALGNFGDLLLYSATSPSMLIYLDAVLNRKAEPNENYAREVLELSSLGVDNRYTQRDIEELARCFTGWSVCKVSPQDVRPFPLNTTQPPTTCGRTSFDSAVVPLGSGWRYFKGTREPTPDPFTRTATTAWTTLEFNDGISASWLSGSTGLGAGVTFTQVATQLPDLTGNYTSVYMRRRFFVGNASVVQNLVLALVYDDAFVAYINGVEVARSPNLARSDQEPRNPPTFDDTADEPHSARGNEELFNVNIALPSLRSGANVLALQVHNRNLGSRDLFVAPRLLLRSVAGDEVENGDPSGAWTFRFDAEEHDTGEKTLFSGTPYEIKIPAGRSGPVGVRDALDVLETLPDHPSTAEFICIKLIQRFVSDEISLGAFRTAPTSIPLELRSLLADMVAAWNSTSPKGNISTVLTALFDPVDQDSAFWSELAYQSKIKTPIEDINSSVRAVAGSVFGSTLPDENLAMGMGLFIRQDPDGWPEIGSAWVDTASLFDRVGFVRQLATGDHDSAGWAPLDFVDTHGLSTAAEIVNHFDNLLFSQTLAEPTKSLLVDFLETAPDGERLDLFADRSVLEERVGAFVGLLLSMPRWHFQ